MIRIDKQLTVRRCPDVTVWEDEKRYNLFYAFRKAPGFDADGIPVFEHITYRLAVDRPDGRKGGGYVFFDTELAIDQEKLVKLKKVLGGAPGCRGASETAFARVRLPRPSWAPSLSQKER